MVRLVLTLCYALTALPGPGLCCCAFRAAERAPAAPAPAEPCCPCCQHESPPPAPDHDPPPPRCGCRKLQPDEATLLDVIEPLALAVAPLDAVSVAPSESVRPDDVPAPAFLEPTRMLRLFHLLRC